MFDPFSTPDDWNSGTRSDRVKISLHLAASVVRQIDDRWRKMPEIRSRDDFLRSLLQAGFEAGHEKGWIDTELLELAAASRRAEEYAQIKEYHDGLVARSAQIVVGANTFFLKGEARKVLESFVKACRDPEIGEQLEQLLKQLP
jgi:hypothetical protein